MYNLTLRLLTILEILQSRGEVSGQELAQTVEAEERSICRYVLILHDIGI
jgi:predicted DNA-binding transcriptional regulator YafY